VRHTFYPCDFLSDQLVGRHHAGRDITETILPAIVELDALQRSIGRRKGNGCLGVGQLA